jgi:hypothetical protein
MISPAQSNLLTSRAELVEEHQRMVREQWQKAVARNLRAALLHSDEDDAHLVLLISRAIAGMIRTSPDELFSSTTRAFLVGSS